MSVEVHIEQYATVVGGTSPGGGIVGVVQFHGPLLKAETITVSAASQLYALESATRYVTIAHRQFSTDDLFAVTGLSSTTLASGAGALVRRTEAGGRTLFRKQGDTHLVLTPDADP